MKGSRSPFERNQLLFEVILCVAVFLLFFFSENDTLSGDETTYLSWAKVNNLWTSVGRVGKEPFPIWISKPFLHVWGFNVQVGRAISSFLGVLTLFLFLRIGRRYDVPWYFSVFILLSCPYFVFYSRMFMYEIYLVFFFTLFFYSLSCFERDESRAKKVLIISCFFGCLTKASFFIALIILPFYLVMAQGQSLKRTIDEVVRGSSYRRRILVPIEHAFLGYLLAILFLATSGHVQRYFELRNRFAVDTITVLKRIFSLNTYSLRVLLIDIGPGVLVGLVLVFALLVFKKRIFAALVFCLQVLVCYIVTAHYPRWIWARYMIPCFPLFVFLMYWGIGQIQRSDPSLRKVLIGLVLLLQIIPFYRTSLPMLFDLRQVFWTRDEVEQHLNGEVTGTLGALTLIKKVEEVGTDYRLEIQCFDSGGSKFPRYFCKYLKMAYPSFFEQEKPLREITYFKAANGEGDFAEERVLIKFDQKIKSSQNAGHLYLIEGFLHGDT